MKDERPVPFEKWATNFRVSDLDDSASAWDSARAAADGTDGGTVNKEGIRTLIRGEISAAFALMSADADTWHNGYGSGDLESSAARVLIDVADRVVQGFAQVEHEPEPGDESETRALIEAACVPVNPFAPQRSASQWADDIRALIEQAQNDGHEVWIDSADGDPNINILSLRVGSDDTAPYIWGGSIG